MKAPAGAAVLLVMAALAVGGCQRSQTAPAPLAPPAATPLVAAGPASLLPTPTLIPALATANAGEPTVTPVPAPTATATVTPVPAERLETAEKRLAVGDFETAAAELKAVVGQPAAIGEAQLQAARLNLGLAYLQDGQARQARDTLREFVDSSPGDVTPAALFQLGQALAASGDLEQAVASYRAYLERRPEMAAYVQPLLAKIYLEQGERPAAIGAYLAAVQAPSIVETQVANRLQLARLQQEEGDFAAAVAQYDAVVQVAASEQTRGHAAHQAATLELLSGNAEEGYRRYQEALTAYPRAFETYLGLVALVDAEIEVDDYQRGLVDYYAAAYEPAVAAFSSYLESKGDDARPDATLYLAWSQEALGNVVEARQSLEAYRAIDPARYLLEAAEMSRRAGLLQAALDAYLEYLEAFPDGEEAEDIAWEAAALTEALGELETAQQRYQAIAEAFPESESAAGALFKAGQLAHARGDQDGAGALWLQVAQRYPDSPDGAAALVWLWRMPEFADAEAAQAAAALKEQAGASTATHYYGLRARDLALGVAPFEPTGLLSLPVDGEEVQAEAEQWLAQQLGLASADKLGELAPVLAADSRLVVGSELWRLGLLEAAKLELESLRRAFADDAISSYQLALAFRDLGLYRSSILAAESVLRLTGRSALEAPALLGQLAYPIYYADLILELAARYGYDPRLQFALVRQESLFESFARSGAAAQGLSQVIPDTGSYIAERLAWPEYENEDLYKPYVGLEFGAYYLDQQLQGFDGQVHAALAAYNAGPGNSARWYESADGDHDLFLETIDFGETKQYLERIYAGYHIYRQLYPAPDAEEGSGE